MLMVVMRYSRLFNSDMKNIYLMMLSIVSLSGIRCLRYLSFVVLFKLSFVFVIGEDVDNL